MNGLVLDASAALLLLRGERDHHTVRSQLRDGIVAGEPILVPTLFWVDVIHALASHHAQPPAVIVEAVYELDQLGIETAEIGRPGVLALIDAVGRGVSASDAAYLVLAESADARLLTGAPLLAAIAGDRAILVGPSRRGGRRPRADRSWTGWRGAAAYLRELRASL